MKKTGWIVLTIFILAAPAAHAKIYKWVDANGVSHYSQDPPPTEALDVEEQHETESTWTPRETPEPEPEPQNSRTDYQKQREETKRAEAEEKAKEDEKYAAAYQTITDIHALLRSTGVTFENYTDLIQTASIEVNRLPRTERASKLAEILSWHKMARDCWYNEIYRKETEATAMKSISTTIYMELGVIPEKTFSGCRQTLWSNNTKLLREYQQRYK